MLIAGDIGGRKADLAIYSTESGPHAPLAKVEVHSSDWPNLQAIVVEFLSQTKIPVETASFDVAPPVIDGHVKTTTNLPWIMDENSLKAELRLKSVHLMNDLEAVARGVPGLRSNDLITLSQGDPIPEGPIAITAPGTGLGESFLTWDGSRCPEHRSEGACCDFAPTDKRQIRLLEFMLERFDPVGVEPVAPESAFPISTNIFVMSKKYGKRPMLPK
jgi:glucokinase